VLSDGPNAYGCCYALKIAQRQRNISPGSDARFAVAIAHLTATIHHCRRTNQSGAPMAKLFCCRVCMIEMARVELADGTAALICVDCDVIGLAHEMAGGGPMWSAGLSAGVRAAKRRRPRPRSEGGGAARVR
jgi:hypothetical protein